MVSEPEVLFAAMIASRNDIPSGPGSAIKLLIDEVSPFTSSRVVVTDTLAALVDLPPGRSAIKKTIITIRLSVRLDLIIASLVIFC